MKRGSLLLAALVLLSAVALTSARADEFKLKDGSTIIGTVVGYVGSSFKVKTSYGFALVEKDKIVSIRIASAAETPSPEKTSKAEARKTPTAVNRAGKQPKEAAPAQKRSADATRKGSSAAADATAEATAKGASRPAPPSMALAGSPSAPRSPREASQDAVPASSAVPASAPGTPSAAQPEPIREKVTGNTYVNDTYEFEMYKPPDWQVMDGARSVLPGAIAAMGTDDQSTYLVIGQEAAGKSAAADIAATEKRLSDILVNFRPLDDEKLTVSGVQVVAHRFRGNVDEQDWSGFMVFVPRGEKLYTIFGMTRANNDLVQIQENVIRRTISSFQFLPQ
ncbi:MAG: hypothetical protein ACRD4X_13210 [Candidatus Acidiferrales bacterium]